MSEIYDAAGQLVKELRDEGSEDSVTAADRLYAMIEELVIEEVNLRESFNSGPPSGFGAANDDDLAGRQDMVEASRKAYYRNPIGRNAIEATRLFVCGAGCTVQAVDEDKETQIFLDEFDERNKMPHRISEYVRRTLRDGDGCLRGIVNEGRTKVRFLEPLRIIPNRDDPRSFGMYSQSGIVTDPQDIEEVLYYWYDTTGDQNGDLKIPASEVYHAKLYADGDMLHGRPLLEPVLKRLAQYEHWVEMRAKLNHLKTAVYLIRKVRGTQGAVAKAVSDVPMSRRAGRTGMAKLPPGPTMLTSTDNIDYQFTEPKLDAKDVAEDGRKLILDVAAGLTMPLPLLTGDVSESTYAGLLVAETPFVKRAQDLQRFFSVPIGELYSEVLKAGIEAGLLPEESKETTMTDKARAELEHWEEELRGARGDDRRTGRARSNIARLKTQRASFVTRACQRKTKVQLIWDKVIHRDAKRLAEAMEIWERLGIASRFTMSTMAGLNWEDELLRMAAERVPDDAELGRLDDEIEAGAGNEIPEPTESEDTGETEDSET